MKFFQVILVSVLMFLSVALSSQSIEWSDTGWLGRGNAITETADNGILLSGSPLLYKYSTDGELLWEKIVCDSSHVLYSTELPNGDLLHLSHWGQFYISDSEGDDSSLVGSVIPDSLINVGSWLGEPNLISVEPLQGGLRTTFSVYSNGSQIVEASFDYSTFDSEILTYPWPDGYHLVDRNHNLNSGESVKLHLDLVLQNNDYERQYSYEIFDSNNVSQFIIPIDSLNMTLRGIVLGDNREVYIAGYYKGFPTIRLVRKYDREGNLLFERRIESNDDATVVYETLKLHQDRLLVGGWSSRGPWSGQAHLDEFDANTGVTNWTLTEYILVSDEVRSLLYLENGSVIASGIGGTAPADGPSSSIIFKVNPPVLSVESNHDSDIEIYPNPTTGIVHIQNSGRKIQKLEILDLHGKLLQSSFFSHSIDLSTLPSSTYYLKVITETGSFSQKIVKY